MQPHLAPILFVLILASSSSAVADESNQVRAEFGIAGPGGLMALRYSRVLSETGTRIEPAVGLAYTGVLGSLLVTQPLYTKATERSWGRQVDSFEVYGGYSLSALTDNTRHSGVGDKMDTPNGLYHWLDLGISFQGRLPWFTITAGVGATVSLGKPDGVGAASLQSEDQHFWWLMGEGWLGRKAWAPAMWSSVGWEF